MNAQNYRKASAEALGFILYDKEPGKIIKGDIIMWFSDWNPDKDANQMLMVWEWWKDREGYGYVFDQVYRKIKEHNGIDIGNTVLLATTEAFMSYYETIK